MPMRCMARSFITSFSLFVTTLALFATSALGQTSNRGFIEPTRQPQPQVIRQSNPRPDYQIDPQTGLQTQPQRPSTTNRAENLFENAQPKPGIGPTPSVQTQAQVKPGTMSGEREENARPTQFRPGLLATDENQIITGANQNGAGNSDELDNRAETGAEDLENVDAPPQALTPQQQADYAYQDDPFAALGLKVGRFLLYPELVIETLATDNIFSARRDRKSDIAIEFRPSLRGESDFSRHALAFALRGTFNDHRRFSSEDEETIVAELRGRLDLTHKTNVDAEFNYERDQEGRGSLDSPFAASAPTRFQNYRVQTGLSHRFNRLTVSLRGGVGHYDYDDVRLLSGAIENNDDRDYRENQGRLRLTYDFRPGLSTFTEGELRNRDYSQKIDDDGFRRDSHGAALRGGLVVDIGPKLSGEISAGYKWQHVKDARLESVEGVIVDADIEWRFSPLTTVFIAAGSEIDETTVTGASAIFMHSASLGIRHAFRRNLIVTAGAEYEIEDYKGINAKQRTLTFDAGGELLLSRNAALIGNYEFTHVGGEGEINRYRENEVRLGLRLRR